MARNNLFIIICIVVLVEVSSHTFFLNDKKSSACVGAKTLACTKHSLTCPQNQQIKINYAFYGFIRKEHGCSTHRTTCNSQKGCDCELFRDDCGLRYTRVDNAEVMRCSGQRSCNPSSPASSDNLWCGRIWGNSKYNPKNSYTEIDYECIKAQRIDPVEPNIIRGHQIVLNASKDYAYTYTVSSTRWWKSVLFYQTNRNLKPFSLHGHLTHAGYVYELIGKFEFTIQPNTDTFIVLTGRHFMFQSDLTVSYKRHKTGKYGIIFTIVFVYGFLDEKTTTTPTHPHTHLTIKPTNQRPHSTIKPTTPRRFNPTSTSYRPKSEIRTTTETFEKKTKPTTKAIEVKTQRTTGAFEVTTETTTEAFIMEEVTRNIEDEIIKEENNDKMRPQASVAEEHSRLTGGLIGAVVGGIVALIIILLIVCICKRRSQKTEIPVAVNTGINNPAYEVAYSNPKVQEPPPAYEEINSRYDNSRVPDDQKSDVKDAEFRHLAGLNVKDFDLNEKQ